MVDRMISRNPVNFVHSLLTPSKTYLALMRSVVIILKYTCIYLPPLNSYLQFRFFFYFVLSTNVRGFYTDKSHIIIPEKFKKTWRIVAEQFV